MSFSGYECWKTADVHAVLTVEAEQPSDKVFLATYTPIPLKRSDPPPPGQGYAWQDYSREDFLREFLDPNRSFTLVPVLGASGAGKSHLIRWLDTQIERTPQRRVIRIPKFRTNLRDVIGLLLEGLEDERFVRFREKLDKAVATKSVEQARFDLITRLAGLVGRENPANPTQGTEGTVTDNLPDFLLDAVLRPEWLKEGGVIDRFVREALSGKQADKERPFAFKEDDLPKEVNNLRGMAQKVQKFAMLLRGNLNVKAAVLNRLNLHLPAAIRALHDIGGDELLEVLRGLRAELFRQGQEVILLIEDFALLQGVQNQLLEAIIQQPDREGRQYLCNIRTAIAVTTGYFDSLDTVRTRATFAVTMDSAQDEVSSREKAEFAARYLNAVRLGLHQLDRAEEPSRLNACDGCVHRVACHLTFGSVSLPQQGVVGLYPFNLRALEFMVERISRERFNPRAVIRDVLRYTLQEATLTLSQGQFPTTAFQEKFPGEPLSIPKQREIENLFHEPHLVRQASSVLRLWAPGPEEASHVMAAFRLPQLEGNTTISPPDPPAGLKPPPPPAPPPTGQHQYDPLLANLAAWAGGHELLQEHARTLRETLFRHLEAQINWEMELISLDYLKQNGLWTNSIIYFQGQSTGNPVTDRDRLSLVLPTPPKTAAQVAYVLEGLVKAERAKGWSFEHAEEYRRATQISLRHWGQEVVRQLHEITDRMLPVLLGGLYWSHVVLGDLKEGPALLRAIVAEVAPDKKLADPLGELAALALSLRKGFREAVQRRIGVYKGSGQTRFIDAARALEALQGLERGHLPPVQEAWFGHGLAAARAYADFSRKLDPVLERATDKAAALLAEIERWVPVPLTEREWQDVQQAVAQAFADAGGAGTFQVGAPNFSSLQDLARSATGIVELSQCLDRVRRVGGDKVERMALMTDLFSRDPEGILQALRGVESTLDSSIQSASTQLKVKGADPGQLEHTIQKMRDVLVEIKDLCKSFTKGGHD